MSDTDQPIEPQVLGDLKIRMDKSRAHSTVHGVRGPDDPHQHTHFYQDGLPYDAQGYLILDPNHIDYNQGTPQEIAKRRQLLEKKVKKAASEHAKRRTAPPPDGIAHADNLDPNQDEDEEEEQEPINLDAWVRGQQQLEWNDVTQAIAQRYKKRMSKVDDAVPFLVDELHIPANEVAKKFQKYL